METISVHEAPVTTQRFWSNRRVFVTGATGIVGSWLVRALVDRGADVVALVRDHDPRSELVRSGTIARIAVVNGCLEEYGTLERAINQVEADTVFHLGAQTIVGTALRGPLATFETNIRGTYNLLEACRRLSPLVRQVVVASSDKAYGESPVLPYTEQMPLLGRHPYDVSKSCTDLLAAAYAHTYRLPVAIARCGNIYGGGDLNWSRIVPGSIRSIHDNERPIIRSNGHYIRDYIYVRDVVEGYLRLAELLEVKQLVGEAFNFSMESRVSVLSIVETIIRLMGRPDLEPTVQDSVTAEIHEQYLTAGKARDVIGWRPHYDLETGLQETIDWYQRYLNDQQEPAQSRTS